MKTIIKFAIGCYVMNMALVYFGIGTLSSLLASFGL